MTASSRLGPRRGLTVPHAVVMLAWGVDLHTSPGGEVHESLAEAELIDPFTERPDLEAVVATEQHGPDFTGDLLVISRTLTCVGGGLGDVTDKVTPPTDAETAAVHAALDYLGYTGPRQVRLLLTVDGSAT